MAIAFVQSAHSFFPTVGPPYNYFASLPHAVQANSLLLAVTFAGAFNGSATGPFLKPVDNLGNNWSYLTGGSNPITLQLWYAWNAQPGICTLNLANRGVGQGGLSMTLYEFSGVDYVTAADQHAFSPTNVLSINAGVTPTQNNELVFTSVYVETSTPNPPITVGTGWTAGETFSSFIFTGFTQQDGYILQTTAHTANPNGGAPYGAWDIHSAALAGAVTASFFAATGAPPALNPPVAPILGDLTQFGYGI